MEYRNYTLVLNALNPIQKGIQSLHSTVEYISKYQGNPDLEQWIKNDKTTILLNAGNFNDLKEIEHLLWVNKIDYAIFREEDLGDIITSITIIVPSTIYAIDSSEDNLKFFNDKEKIIYQIISSKRLAN